MSKDTEGPGPLDLLYAQHDRPFEGNKAVLEKSVRRKEQAVSRATELAASLGITFNYLGQPQCVFATTEMIEAFYHAARAEALREAADKWQIISARELRAMADREGK